MKNLAAAIVLLMVCNVAYSQDAISQFFSKYQSDETFSQVTVSSKMFSAISKLKGLRILQKTDSLSARRLYKEAFGLIPAKDYEELMSYRDKDKDFKFMIKEAPGGKISELLMIMGGSKEFMVLSLFGEIDLKQVSRIGQKMDVKGLENLQKMDSKPTDSKPKK
jgi:hypothetical protein